MEPSNGYGPGGLVHHLLPVRAELGRSLLEEGPHAFEMIGGDSQEALNGSFLLEGIDQGWTPPSDGVGLTVSYTPSTPPFIRRRRRTSTV